MKFLSFILLAFTVLTVGQAQAQATKVSREEFEQILKSFTSPQALTSCRHDGYSCQGSYQCCGWCDSGECKGETGGPSCRSDGASCSGSYQCCGWCDSGVCKGESGGPSCREEGLSCSGSYQCCGWCDDGVCKGG